MKRSAKDVLCCCLMLVCRFTATEECTPLKRKPCACVLDNREVIDLSSIGNTDGSPRFSYVIGPYGTTMYAYNPCYPFTTSVFGDDCKNVAGCLMDFATDYSLGPQSSAQFTTDSTGAPAIRYSGGADGRGMLVKLVCDKGDSPYLTAEGDEGHSGLYYFTLSTKCACGNGCYTGPPPTIQTVGEDDGSGTDAGIVGIVLILLTLLGFALYFSIGAVIRRHRHNATGWDIVPNKEFWKSLPFLVKDGLVFTFKPCVDAVRRKDEGNSSIINNSDQPPQQNYGT